jgi:hypothetical protein
MRIRLLLLLLLLPLCAQAQDLFTVKGRIVNEAGNPVEYVHVGIPSQQIGTVSSVDGRFEIEVQSGTLEFHHVSYQTGLYPISGPKEDVLIFLHANELPPAIAIGGDTREKYLVRPGTSVGNSLIDFYQPTTGVIGGELGSIAKARKPFLVRDIMFTIESNYIPGCVASINIYSIEGNPETFVNVLHQPIYVNIPMSETSLKFDIKPDELILLEPGKYFIGFQIISVDENAVQKNLQSSESESDRRSLHMYAPLYIKSSYHRSSVLGELKAIPVNIGISVKGLEYQ